MHPGGMNLDSHCINIFEDQNGITMTSFNLEPTGVLLKKTSRTRVLRPLTWAKPAGSWIPMIPWDSIGP